MTILEADRITLRKLTPDDTDALFEILSDEETMQYYPRPYTKQETADWITRSIESYKKNGYGLWAIELQTNKQFIGQCGISNQDIDGTMVPEIGYQVNKQYWNNGYATEAASACLNYGFEHLLLKEIYIHTYIKNIPSIRIAQKLGMTEKKVYDKVMNDNESTMRHVVYSIRKQD